MTPDRAPTVQQLLAFYLEAGVDCALTDEPVNRLSDPDIAPCPRRTARALPPGTIPVRPVPRRAGDIRGAPEVAIQSAREAARTAPSLEVLRALLEKFDGCALKSTATPGVRRRQSAGAHHVRRRGARPRGRHRGPAVRRTFRQVARPDDRGDRAQPHAAPTSPMSFRGGRPATARRRRRRRKSACRSSSARSNWSIRTCWSRSAIPRPRPCCRPARAS